MSLYTVTSLRVVRARVKCVLIYCNIIDSGQSKSKVCSYILWHHGQWSEQEYSVFLYTVTSLTVVRARVKYVLIYCNIIDSGQSKSTVCSYIL